MTIYWEGLIMMRVNTEKSPCYCEGDHICTWTELVIVKEITYNGWSLFFGRRSRMYMDGACSYEGDYKH